MLQRLSIRNIVLIEACDIELQRGLCVLSGETGAGKSILLDSLGLVLGARADSGLLRRGETSGMVTAEFDITDNRGALDMLDALGLEASDSLIIRRSMNGDGKTRCFANDHPISVTGLKRLGETLVEVHGQHDQRGLNDSALHRQLLDEYGKHLPQRKKVAAAYAVWKKTTDDLQALQEKIAETAREQEYLKHMHNELKGLNPKVGEEDALTDLRTGMMQHEKLFDVLDDAIKTLNANGGVLAALRDAQRTLTRSNLCDGEQFSSVIEGLEKAAIESEEALYNLEHIGQNIEFNPDTLEQAEERLFALKAAGRKYNMPVDELATLYGEVEEKLQLMDSQDHQLGGLQKACAQAQKLFLVEAEVLRDMRKKTSVKLTKAIENELAPLKMASTRFQVRVAPLEQSDWSETGADGVYFECATNVTKADKNISFSGLNKIASGGELSRFMLAMKVALAKVRSTPTLIFDEIDTGTGGAVAAAIGDRLSVLGEHAQVLVVTHLPQVAARGVQHLHVSKHETSKKVTTRVVPLDARMREEELARMLAGAEVTQEARKAAQKLLEPAA